MSNFNFEKSCHLKRAVCEKNLGNGGFAFVRLYKCIDTHENDKICNQLFVVKQVRYTNIPMDSLNQIQNDLNKLKNNINNEYNINQILEHENIIKTFDIDRNKGAILYEYFDAEDMLDYLNRNTNKDISFFLNSYNDLLYTIDYLHSKHYIAHMDIKLENILINNITKKIKLIDFGFSRYFKLNNIYISSHELFGTESYLPPEFFTKLTCNPDKVDIWSLGILLYNLVYDKMPWECAKQTERHFNNYKYAFYNLNMLPIQTFGKCNLLSNEDNIYISECFKNALHIDPNKRCNIKTLIYLFNKLSIVINK